jgi:hypothetical protein
MAAPVPEIMDTPWYCLILSSDTVVFKGFRSKNLMNLMVFIIQSRNTDVLVNGAQSAWVFFWDGAVAWIFH